MYKLSVGPRAGVGGRPRRPECVQGHDQSVHRRVSKSGATWCAECARLRPKKRSTGPRAGIGGRPKKEAGGVCKRGHDIDKAARRCQVCRAVNARAWQAANPDKRLASQLAQYGISPAVFHATLEAQNGVCAICGDPPGAKRLHVDHCHRTGRFRGILCSPCNVGLGSFRDDPARLKAATAYLGVQ